VTLRISIDKKGNVVSSRVLDATDPRFVESAQRAVRKWGFLPALENGKPVAGSMDSPVIFSPDNPYFKGPSPSYPPEEQMPYLSPTTAAALLSEPDIEYPESLYDRKLSGRARFSCTVLPDGNTYDPRVLSATHVEFVLPALRAVEHLKYSPRMKGDVPLQAEVVGELKFVVLPHDPEGALAADMVTSPDGSAPPEGLELLQVVDPIWPYDLLIAGKQGSAVVHLTVDKLGSPIDVRISSASNPDFGEALSAAVEMSTFVPALIDGHSAALPLMQHFEFKTADMNSEAESNPITRIVAALRNNEVRNTQGLDEKLTPLYRMSPKYPPSLKESGRTTGSAEIEFIVDRDGRVRLPRIVSASDIKFGWAAATAVSQWVFKMPRRHGEPVDVRVRIPFQFKVPTD
jgi:TonB family protein